MQYLKDRGFVHPHASDITPRAVYEQRRDWLRQMAAGAAGLAMAGWASRDALAQARQRVVRDVELGRSPLPVAAIVMAQQRQTHGHRVGTGVAQA